MKRNNLKAFAMTTVLSVAIVLSACKDEKKTVWEQLALSTPDTPSEAALYVQKEVKALNDSELNELARALVDSRDLEFVQGLTNELIYKSQDKQDKKLAVYIAEQGYLMKKDAFLANRAALEYKLGRFVTKDYEKASTMFSSTTLKNAALSKFYLAEIMLAKDNPNSDPKAGKALLIQAANAGFEPAQKKLKELN